ncbi:MAG: transglutaminase-like domain-containing protein [Methylacidiphilales bacterium]|nr:transglutaminase-like domain-containing protein [Candidatus Methylacidiphilales bacterium]
MMTASQQKALVSLLQDGDADTIGLIKGKLIEGGQERLPEYQELLAIANGVAQENLREVIREIEASKTLGDISRGLAKLRTISQLEELCWEFTRTEHPGFNGGPYTRQLDQWAEEAGRLILPGATPREKVLCLSRYLAQEQGLAGNSHEYYHPRNCYLPWVMEFRCGLPITVTLIYMLVGHRLNLPVEGVAAPGHFLARLEGVVFDPYHRGRILSDAELELIASEVPQRQRIFLTKPSTPAQIMHRLLINLRNCYVKSNDVERRKMVDHYLAVLQR